MALNKIMESVDGIAEEEEKEIPKQKRVQVRCSLRKCINWSAKFDGCCTATKIVVDKESGKVICTTYSPK